MLTAALAAAVVLFGPLQTIAAAQSEPAKWIKAEKPITDEKGRIRYIVLLQSDDGAMKNQKFTDAKSALEWKKARAAENIDSLITSKAKDIEGVEKVKVLSRTTASLPSFVAYLNEEQAKAYASDKSVVSITQDRVMDGVSSAPPPWYNSYGPGPQTRPWGLTAMNNANPERSNGYATVFVVDLGAEVHPDITGLTSATQVNAVDIATNPSEATNPDGCWPHATHIAGIIGAQNNEMGTVGMLPGVKIVSVSLSKYNLQFAPSNSPPFHIAGYNNPIDCAGSLPYLGAGSIALPELSAMTTALDYIYGQTYINGKASITNWSMNGGAGTYEFGTGAVASFMTYVAIPWSTWIVTPWGWGYEHFYRGSLIVQSAGNFDQPACNWAYNRYNTAHPSDGIIVVGGLNQLGQKVSPPGYGNAEVGSNHGSCVDMWAPSMDIFSTWTSKINSPYWNSSTNSAYKVLGGTSMAAPHVAGFAARLLEENPWATAPALESLVRAKLVNPGSGFLMPAF